MITLEGAKSILEGLRIVQYAIYDYLEFLKVLKKRIMRYTGDTTVLFYDERQLVMRMGELGVLQEMSEVRAGSK